VVLIYQYNPSVNSGKTLAESYKQSVLDICDVRQLSLGPAAHSMYMDILSSTSLLSYIQICVSFSECLPSWGYSMF